ncbi:hypothetical protein FKG94_12205 [Exilibacterium tricleocarpae]|uniref:Uncharacterized protein n=1 Tax=Exilibacterium tricleocarpae TaxID=2591008 RepID=A0A545TNH5_9GAMM|nr:hypothetical protein [Exilibacterium tricleocarpae]TQV78777.1 hypothetical protein FKG94_12205 [Exilibacterium tricleocarpae]
MYKHYKKITVAIALLSIIVFLSFQALVATKIREAAEPARQYLSAVIQDFPSWDIKKFDHYLTSNGLKEFNSSGGQDLLRLLNSMGKVVLVNNPSFFGTTTGHLNNGAS